MDSIKITTSQNVDLEYEAAGIGYRILATMLDEVFKMVYVIIGLLILGLTAKSNPHLYDGDKKLHIIYYFNSCSITIYVILFFK